MSAGMFQAVLSEYIGLWHDMSLDTVLSLTSVGLTLSRTQLVSMDTKLDSTSEFNLSSTR